MLKDWMTEEWSKEMPQMWIRKAVDTDKGTKCHSKYTQKKTSVLSNNIDANGKNGKQWYKNTHFISYSTF